MRNPISYGRVWAALRCAGWEVGVGTVRVRMTFLWMSDPFYIYMLRCLKAELMFLLFQVVAVLEYFVVIVKAGQ